MKKLIYAIVISVAGMLFSCSEESVSTDSCGDGVLDMGEECDGLSLQGESCTTKGFWGGDLRCSDQCNFDTTDCEDYGWCGDGILQDEEECEGDIIVDTCSGVNTDFLGGTLSCSEQCQYNTSQCYGTEVCGDGVVQPHEACDGVNLNSQTCEGLGFYGTGLLCDSTCGFDTSACAANGSCGDGVVQTAFGEDCDTVNALDISCLSLGYLTGVVTVCGDDCTYDISSCNSCGDSVIQPELGETCDGTVFEQTCVSQGLWGDVLCDSQCHTQGLGNCNDTQIVGTNQDDTITDTLVDGTRVYVVGYTQGDISDDGTVMGERDAFVAAYNLAGERLWSHQFGADSATADDRAVSLEKHPVTGNLLVAGNSWSTAGDTFAGHVHSGGGSDVFVAEFSTDGVHLGTRLLGSSGDDIVNSIRCSIYEYIGVLYSFCHIAGSTTAAWFGPHQGGQDWFVYRFEGASFPALPLEIVEETGFQGGGPQNDTAYGAIMHISTGPFAADMIIAGGTQGGYLGVSPGEQKVFVGMFSAVDGTIIGTPFSSSSGGADIAHNFRGVQKPTALEDTIVLLAGETSGSFSGYTNGGGGNTDAFVIRCVHNSPMSAGEIQCAALQFGEGADDRATAVTYQEFEPSHYSISAGTLLLTGTTCYGALESSLTSYGACDVWVQTMRVMGAEDDPSSDPIGPLYDAWQMGSVEDDEAVGGGVDETGRVIVGGTSSAGFENGTSLGGTDGFIFRWMPYPDYAQIQ